MEMKEYIIKINEDKKDIMGNYPLVEKPQELVRCKDCKHWEQSNGHCPFNSIFTNEDWFCADGKRC